MKKGLILILVILFFSCDFAENRFVSITNESDKVVYCFISKTDISKIKDISETKAIVKIKQNKFEFLVPITRGRWEEFLELCDDKRARVYIVEKDSVDKYGWSIVFSKALFSKEYLLEKDDLTGEKMNIIYE